MIDLHTHTTYSDGTLTPEKLIERALDIGLSAIAITDHDTTDAIDPAIESALGKPIKVIPGIEIEVDFYPGEFHLLGLNLKDWKGQVSEAMTEIRQKRENRNRWIIKEMQNQGWDITYEEVAAKATSDLIARPHIAAVLVDKKIVKNTKQAFEKYLAMGRPFYTRKEALCLEDAIELVKGAGGKPVVAHPLSLYLSWGKLEIKMAEFKEMGIVGLEAWHPGTNLNKAHRLEKTAERLGLFITGGSDYHGDLRKDRRLGCSSSGKTIPDEYLDFLL